jgi:hypothetical protein
MAGMEPIRHSLTVEAPPEVAFEVFTLGTGSWWDAGYTPDPGSFDGIGIGAEVGSPVSMVHGDETHTWGNVTVWEPPTRYAQTFWLAMDAAHPSTIEATFTAEGPRTRVDFEHGGWTDENAAFHEKYRDWPHLLERYADAVARTG